MQAFCSHVYIHMFLFCFVVSVAYKCHVERGSRVAVHYWKEYITSVSPLHCIISGVYVCTCIYMYVCTVTVVQNCAFKELICHVLY